MAKNYGGFIHSVDTNNIYIESSISTRNYAYIAGAHISLLDSNSIVI